MFSRTTDSPDVWNIATAKKALYQGRAIPDSIYRSIETSTEASHQFILFLRGYNASINDDQATLLKVINKYEQAGYISSYYFLLEYLALCDSKNATGDSLLMRALDLQDSESNEFLHYHVYHALLESNELEAIAHLDVAIQIQSDFDMAAKYRSYHYRLPDDCSKIIKLLSPLEAESGDYDLHMYLGDAYQLSDSTFSAKRAYERASEASPSFESYEAFGDMRLASGDSLRLVESSYRQALAIQENSHLRTKIGWLYHSNDLRSEAISEFVLCAAIHPCASSPILALMLLEEWQEATRIYVTMKDCDASDPTLGAYGVVLNCVKFSADQKRCHELIAEYMEIYKEDSDAITHMESLIQRFELR